MNKKGRSTFRTCWISTGTPKCISLTISQFIRETFFSCRSASVFFYTFRNFLPFGDGQLFGDFLHAVLAELKSYKYYFLDDWRNLNFFGQQRLLNSINEPLFYKFWVLNLYPKLLIFPLLLNFSVHSEPILSRCVRHMFSFLWRCSVDFSEPIIVWWVPGNNFKLSVSMLLNC